MIIALLIKFFLYVKDPYDAKYQCLIKNMEKCSWKSERFKDLY